MSNYIKKICIPPSDWKTSKNSHQQPLLLSHGTPHPICSCEKPRMAGCPISLSSGGGQCIFLNTATWRRATSGQSRFFDFQTRYNKSAPSWFRSEHETNDHRNHFRPGHLQQTDAQWETDLKCCFASQQVFSFITESVRREIRWDVARDIILEIAAGKFGPDWRSRWVRQSTSGKFERVLRRPTTKITWT